MTTPSPTVKWLAIAAILATGFIHAVEARDAFGDAAYKGLLFIGNGAGALAAAIGIYRDQRALGWLLGPPRRRGRHPRPRGKSHDWVAGTSG